MKDPYLYSNKTKWKLDTGNLRSFDLSFFVEVDNFALLNIYILYVILPTLYLFNQDPLYMKT